MCIYIYIYTMFYIKSCISKICLSKNCNCACLAQANLGDLAQASRKHRARRLAQAPRNPKILYHLRLAWPEKK